MADGMKLADVKKELYDCTRCGFCRVWNWKGVDWVCPTYPYTEAYDTQYARGRIRMAQAFFENEADITETYMQHAMQCSLCGSCAVHCPVDIPLFEVWHAWRSDMVEAGHILPIHQETVEAVEKYHSVFGPRPSKQPHENGAKPKPQADVLYFPGCQTNRKVREIGRATTELLTKLEVNFATLEEDACCGYPLYDIGHMAAMKRVAQHTLAKIKEYGPKVVLTTCIGCYRALTHVYSEELGLDTGLTVQHIHEFLPPLVKDKLAALNRKVTFHDPCIMGRHMGIYDEPREVIASVPGVELVEMRSNREHALCCGAGGGVFRAFDELAGQVSAERLRQAQEAGAEQVVSSCPTCVLSMKLAARKADIPIKVTDIVELINEAVVT
jgi:heterodisulfide reductase subunit D